MAQPGSPDDGGSPFRYTDAAYRISERIEKLERACSDLASNGVRQEVRLGTLELGFSKHLDRASVDADRAAESAQRTLDEVRSLREDISIMKARTGTVPVETIQRLVAIIGGGFMIVAAVIGGILWLVEKGGT